MMTFNEWVLLYEFESALALLAVDYTTLVRGGAFMGESY